MFTSGVVTLTFIILLIAYDLWALFYFGVDGTVSAWVRWCNNRWPLFGVLLGIVIGGLLVHWFGLY